jgi:hypothetical protein
MIQNISLGLSQSSEIHFKAICERLQILLRTRKPKPEPQEEYDCHLRKKTIPFARIAKPKYRDIYTDNAIKGGLTPENLACLPRIKIRASTPSDQRNSSHKTIWSYPHRNVGHRGDNCFQ